jgi:hypothetical protein
MRGIDYTRLDSREGRLDMSNVTPSREEISAKIRAATSEVYTTIATFEGKLDGIGLRIDAAMNHNEKIYEGLREDTRDTRFIQLGTIVLITIFTFALGVLILLTRR